MRRFKAAKPAQGEIDVMRKCGWASKSSMLYLSFLVVAEKNEDSLNTNPKKKAVFLPKALTG